jgi:hypothetical protein
MGILLGYPGMGISLYCSERCMYMTSFFTLAGFASSLLQEPARRRLRQYAITAVICGAAIKTVNS